jgi:hypothetical protein
MQINKHIYIAFPVNIPTFGGKEFHYRLAFTAISFRNVYLYFTLTFIWLSAEYESGY